MNARGHQDLDVFGHRLLEELALAGLPVLEERWAR